MKSREPAAYATLFPEEKQTLMDRHLHDAIPVARSPVETSIGASRVFVALIVQTALLLVAMRVADATGGLRSALPIWVWGPMDSLFHGIIAALIVWPMVRLSPRAGWRTLIVAGAVGSLIDIDHFIAAGSFSFDEAIALGCRPWTHSLTFAALCGLITWIIGRERRAGLIVMVALASHVIRDAAGGCTPWLFPLPLRGIPRWTYVVATLVLGWMVTLMAPRLARIDRGAPE